MLDIYDIKTGSYETRLDKIGYFGVSIKYFDG